VQTLLTLENPHLLKGFFMREIFWRNKILLRMREFTSGIRDSINSKFSKAEFKNFMTLENYKWREKKCTRCQHWRERSVWGVILIQDFALEIAKICFAEFLRAQSKKNGGRKFWLIPYALDLYLSDSFLWKLRKHCAANPRVILSSNSRRNSFFIGLSSKLSKSIIKP